MKISAIFKLALVYFIALGTYATLIFAFVEGAIYAHSRAEEIYLVALFFVILLALTVILTKFSLYFYDRIKSK
jgi:uncharacterized membrane protein YoaK (UPF0700 family)